jgi:hypothetical protein
MRKAAVLCFCVLAFGLPAGSQARTDAVGDGSLVVKDGRGTVSVALRGGIIGRFDSGSVWIDDPVAGDGSGPIVYGYSSERQLTPTKKLYIGTDVRFRLVGGFFRAKVNATGINVSAVGRGYATIWGGDALGGFIDAGFFSVNGDNFKPMPDAAKTLQLGAI